MLDDEKTKEQPLQELSDLCIQSTDLDMEEIRNSPVYQTLLKSATRFKDLFEAAPLGIYRITPRGEILDANPAFLQMLDYPDMNSLASLCFADLYVHPEDWSADIMCMEETGRIQGHEVELCCRDKTVIWVRQNMRATVDESGNVAYYEGTVEDITERKRITKNLLTLNKMTALLNSTLDLDEILEKLVDTLHELIGFDHCTVRLVDKEKKMLITKVARGVVEEHWKYSSSIPIGETSYDLSGITASEGKPHYAPDLMRLPMPSDVKENVIKRFAIKSYLSVPLKIEEEVIGVFSIMNEEYREFLADELQLFMSLAEQAAQAIMRARLYEDLKNDYAEQKNMLEFMRCSIDNCATGVLRLNQQLEITHENPEMKRIFGVSSVEDSPYLGKDFREIAPLRRAFTKTDVERLKEGNHVVVDFEYEALDGQKLDLQCNTIPIFDEGHFCGAAMLINDVTERRRSHAEREELQSQLLQTQKMEAVGRLAGGIAHDFNNLLTTIRGYAELSMSCIDDSDPPFNDLEQIVQATDQAAFLTRQLLLFSRTAPDEVTPVNLNTVIAHLMKMLGRVIGEDILIETQLDPKLWRIRTNTSNIQQAIMNLIVNARDAMPTGGRLRITTQNIVITEADRKVMPQSWPGRFVQVGVEDTGVGMGQDLLDRIFEPFFSTKGSTKGPGLGLAVAHGIVTQHRGWIIVHSQPGAGSTFQIYLPAVSTRRLETEKRPSFDQLRGESQVILVVEDEAPVRRFVARVLKDNGYEVLEASGAQQGLDVFIAQKDRIHMLFTDLVLPDGNGLELVHRLTARKPELRIVLSSGYVDEASLEAALREKKYPCVSKPYTVVELLKTIKEHL